jgi:hypothetical protein
VQERDAESSRQKQTSGALRFRSFEALSQSAQLEKPDSAMFWRREIRIFAKKFPMSGRAGLK